MRSKSHIIQVYAAGSEDMDTLTFNAPILYRHLTFSEAKKQPISEINLKAALEGLDMNMSQVHPSMTSPQPPTNTPLVHRLVYTVGMRLP